ncbi:MAG TPA: thiamine phosphate synthase [Puia sp.]|nr:thiamine phosphate synthase [Puia sp.]
MALTPLYFITMDNASRGTTGKPIGHAEQAALACGAGIRMIQLRMKEAPDAEFRRVAGEVKQICDRNGCLLIVNDRVEIAAAVGAHGVHVGKEDLSVDEARRILGPGKIVGGTANTLRDIQKHVAGGADYIGLGPFRFTTTKRNLSPILGLEGYRRIVREMAGEGMSVRLFGIGGIGAADVGGLRDAGLFGVAFSGMLLEAADPAAMVRTLEAEWRNRAGIVKENTF